MDAEAVEIDGRELVGSQIGIFFFHSEIVPCNVFCLIQVAGRYLVVVQAHGRQVVAKADQQRVFTALFQHGNIVLQKLVHIMDTVRVVFPAVGKLLVLAFAFDRDSGIFLDLFRGIIAVGFHSDRVDEVGLRRRIQRVSGSPHENVIGRP